MKKKKASNTITTTMRCHHKEYIKAIELGIKRAKELQLALNALNKTKIKINIES